MTKSARPIGKRILAFGMLTGALLTAGSLAAPGTANARCNGVNNPITSNYYPFGPELVEERAHRDTCNGNSLYNGFLIDRRVDNGAVAVWVQDSEGASYRRVVRHEAPVGVEVPYDFTDRNNSDHVNMRLCANANGGAIDYGCGWAGREGAHGDNTGF